MTRHLLPALAAALALAGAADASRVKVWHQQTTAQYEKAKFQQAVISSDGVIRLSRQVKPLASLSATNVWAVVEDKQGALYAATGDGGKVFKIEGDVAKEVYAGKESQVLSLALGDDGAVFAGTGPAGKVIRIGKDGKGQVFADGLDGYVWSLAYDASAQTLYAGTGPKGKIYRIDGKGKASVFYTTRQEHILALALAPDGTLYAGTDKGGLVYRIDPKGKGFVVYHAHQTEIRSLFLTPDAVFAGTSTPVARKTIGLGTKSGPTDDPARPFPSGPMGGENSVYRIAKDGSVRELLRDKTLMLSLLARGGKLLVGTGMQGQLFEIDVATKDRTEIARLDHGQLHALLQRRDGSVVLGTGDPGKLYALQDRFAPKATVVSEVLDAKMPTRWGALTWKATTPAGTTATVAVRSGNVAEPDDTWSAWSAEQADPLTAKALAPTARYLQYRVTLTSDDPTATPEFRNFAARYQSTNQAPEIGSLEVPDLDTANLDNPKKLKVRWSATDPNDDELTFNLYFRKDGWKDWVLLEENYEKKDYDWDTSGVPSGVYRLKVVASDRKDNAAEESYSAERVSLPVPVSHAPPTVTLKQVGFDGGRAVLEATVTDPFVRLTEASFAVNGKKWATVFPADGLFDSKSETFRFKTEALRPGTYVVLLRVRNAAGSFGSGDVVFTVPAGEKVAK